MSPAMPMTVATPMNPSLESEEQRRAFNAGSNARIAGLPRSINPHSGQDALRNRWNAGWEHAHQYWGADNWRAKPLPPVRGE